MVACALSWAAIVRKDPLDYMTNAFGVPLVSKEQSRSITPAFSWSP